MDDLMDDLLSATNIPISRTDIDETNPGQKDGAKLKLYLSVGCVLDLITAVKCGLSWQQQ